MAYITAKIPKRKKKKIEDGGESHRFIKHIRILVKYLVLVVTLTLRVLRLCLRSLQQQKEVLDD